MSDNEQTNKNRKTLADIVAMVRRAAQYYEGEAEKSEGPLRESFELSAANYRTIANLVEAAWKREKAEIEADALAVGGIVESARHRPGNAAAMRETISLFVHDFASFRKDVEHGIFHMMQCMDFVKKFIPLMESALAAPARNCDLYDDAEIAWRAWLEDKENWDELGSPGLELCEWLFAPADSATRSRRKKKEGAK